MEILLAEDESAIRAAMAILLQKEGYGVRAAADGEQALALYAEKRPDLLLLDIDMPNKNGYRVCEEVRKTDPTLPIVFFTSFDGEMDELRAFNHGADDYIVKTTDVHLVLARLAAVLRRGTLSGVEDAVDFDFGGCHVDAVNCSMRVTSGKVVELSLKEVEILRFFSQHPREVYSVEFLIAKFWGANSEVNDSTWRMTLSRLRDKLGDDNGHLLDTVWGKGCRYNPV